MADNRRSSARHPVSVEAEIVLEGVDQPCKIRNLSLGGAQLTTAARLAMGQRIAISFSVPSMPDPIRVGATVRWCDDQGVGIQFDGLRALA